MTAPTLEALATHNASTTQPGDVIQIIDEKHPWYPALMIVDEIKSFGVQAYSVIPHSNDGSRPPGLAYNRLRWDQITLIGQAFVFTG